MLYCSICNLFIDNVVKVVDRLTDLQTDIAVSRVMLCMAKNLTSDLANAKPIGFHQLADGTCSTTVHTVVF